MNLNKIKNLAVFVLNDKELKKLMLFLKHRQLNDARLFIERIIDEYELDFITSNDVSKNIMTTHLNQLQLIQDEIFNLYEVIYEREQIK